MGRRGKPRKLSPWALRVAYWLLGRRPPPEALSEPVRVTTAVSGVLVAYDHFMGVSQRRRFAIDPEVKKWAEMSPSGDVVYIEPPVNCEGLELRTYVSPGEEEMRVFLLDPVKGKVECQPL